jgi:hypothetical protein
MRIISKTIFSNSPLHTTEEIETKKISYWLEKLFNQKRDNEKGVLRNRIKTQVSVPSEISSDNLGMRQATEEKGLEEAVKSHAGKAEKNRQAVEDMVNNSNRILLRIFSVFPLDLFPSSIIVEETRLTIIHRQLFSSQAYSVDIKNISNVFIDTGILFSQLTIVSDTFAENQVVIDKLWKKEAIFIRRIVGVLRMFVDKDIDTTGYKTEELIDKLRELSTTGIVL